MDAAVYQIPIIKFLCGSALSLFSYRSDARNTKRTASVRGFFEISQFVMQCPWKIQFLEEANYPLVKYMGYSCSIASPVFRR